MGGMGCKVCYDTPCTCPSGGTIELVLVLCKRIIGNAYPVSGLAAPRMSVHKEWLEDLKDAVEALEEKK